MAAVVVQEPDNNLLLQLQLFPEVAIGNQTPDRCAELEQHGLRFFFCIASEGWRHQQP
jgi:hypothetical protein